MGCCSAREYATTRKIELHLPPLKQEIEEEDLARAEDYYFRKCWHQLGYLCYSKEPVRCTKGLRWAYAPTTVGSFAIQLLTTQAIKDPWSLQALPKLFSVLLHYIRNGPDDVRENSLLLLSVSLPAWTEVTKKKFIELEPFNVLCRFLTCSKQELCLCAAEICHGVYKFQSDYQLAFSDARGGCQLLQLIVRCSQNQTTLSTLLTYVEELLSLGDGGVNHLVSARLRYSMAFEILTDIKTNRISKEADEALDRVLAMLAQSFHPSTRL